MSSCKYKVPRPRVDGRAVEMAMRDVREKGLSHREAAKKHGIARTTLVRHLNNCKKLGLTAKYVNNCNYRRVFNDEEEEELIEYVATSSGTERGLTKQSFSKLVYRYAKANEISVPPTWEKQNRAGKKWMRLFFKKHGCLLVLRKSQDKSLGRAAGFNKPVVEAFLKNVGMLIEKHSLTAASIYNMDESGLSTVQNPLKVIAERGVKQVAIASGERGINITLISTVNAEGNSIPPLLVFPRAHFKPHMLAGAPPGTVGVANPSGWSNSNIFVRYLQHFIAHVRPSPENKVMLLLDTHERQCCIEGINLARENGIVMCAFPPHTTHKLQPLDRSVFGPLKTYYHDACLTWMRYHPGTPISIYDVASILGEAYPKAFTPANIVSGFRVAGICPFNSMPFDDHEFRASTERPLSIEKASVGVPQQETAGPSQTPSASKGKSHLRPEDVPSPTKSVNPQTKTRRRLRKSGVLTDTPEKNEIKIGKVPKKQIFKTKRQLPTKKRPVQPEDTSSESRNSDISVFSSCGSDDENMGVANPVEGTTSKPEDHSVMEAEDGFPERVHKNPETNKGLADVWWNAIADIPATALAKEKCKDCMMSSETVYIKQEPIEDTSETGLPPERDPLDGTDGLLSDVKVEFDECCWAEDSNGVTSSSGSSQNTMNQAVSGMFACPKVEQTWDYM